MSKRLGDKMEDKNVFEIWDRYYTYKEAVEEGEVCKVIITKEYDFDSPNYIKSKGIDLTKYPTDEYDRTFIFKDDDGNTMYEGLIHKDTNDYALEYLWNYGAYDTGAVDLNWYCRKTKKYINGIS
jgi:hypothetical protein